MAVERHSEGGRRNFLFQYPLFGRRSNPRPDADWKSTPYYLWWEYLRRHEGYRRCCRQGGKGKYAKLYADFGNVHGGSFRDWWNERGGRLFAEPSEVPFHEVDDIDVLRELDQDRYGIVVVPLHMRKSYLRKAFNRFLTKRHKTEVFRKRRISKARYQFAGRTPVVSALAKTLAIYDYRETNPHARLWEIADHFKISAKDADPLNRVTRRHRQGIVISRYLRHAKAYIANVGLGRFPVKRMATDQKGP